MDKKLLEKIETLHNNDEHYRIIEIVYSMEESERDYDAISLLARALNNTQNYDEALDNLMYIREDGIDDPLWNFRAGYSYFYKNEKDKAKQYFYKTIELMDGHKNIEIEESAKRLYTLCFEDDDNGINFIERINLFWKWFEENEAYISSMIENNHDDLVNFVSSGVKIISDNISFNINKNYEFIFTVDGKNYLFYLIPKVISSMPYKLKEKWTFLPYLPSSEGINFSIEVQNKKIEMQEVLIKIEFDEENDKFDLIFYNTELNNLDKEEAYNIFFIMMENSIGEGLSRIYIRYVDISSNKLYNMISLTELEEYIKKTLQFYRKEFIRDPLKQYFSYTFEPKNIDILRYDIIAGNTLYYETINDYYNENVYDIVEISKCGARALFLSYTYDDENDNDEIRREILNERYEILERLEKEVLGYRGKDIGLLLGGAIGINNIYIDLIVYDEDEFINRAKILLAEYDRNFYISKLRKYSEIKNIFDY
ncbi:tetratricopeptide repeat protein [Brachyspira murdochii]|uniref:TPR domain-containing protein n=1 Tax=Brachyspira murdochii (strain ATCC 51284 / DSM 12563 / 56-150) TaxID=526224 RepID=D5U8B4_BRAM5|nr:hypothetical protein [Brachyspira murdochii]ADG70937.1 conserved hypothetical protein [Brachyspira murdochii DSM 12563]